MGTLTFANPKGGAGKTTSAIIAAIEFAYRGYNVTIICTDRTTEAMSRWQKIKPIPASIQIITNVNGDSLLDIAYANDKTSKDIVIIDLEGIKSDITTVAIAAAHLVVLPMQPKPLDSDVSEDALALMAHSEKILRRKIPYAVIFTATKAIKSKAHKETERKLLGLNIDIISPELTDRNQFENLFYHGGSYRDMPDHKNKPKAIQNAEEYCDALETRLELALKEEAATYA